jgi:hypothetical protein
MNVVSREFLTLPRVTKNDRLLAAILRPRFLQCLLLLSLTATPYVEQSPSPQRTASISGTVLDINEGPVPGAQIALEPQAASVHQIATADTSGSFTFTNLPAGIFKVKITAPGLEPFESYEITLHDSEKFHLPRIALLIATEKVELNITVTEEQLAQEQVDAQIRQRVLGIFPNFYTSFIWNAAPLKPRQNFHLAFRSATDIDSFFNAGALAATIAALASFFCMSQPL